jgi:putative membrane protein
MNLPSKPTGATNELAKERNRAAAERTLASWIQNSVTLIGLGIAFEQIFEALETTFPLQSRVIILKYSQILGLSLIALGIALLIIAIIQHRIIIKSIERDNYISISSRPLNIAIGSAVFIFGVAAVIVILLSFNF